MDYSDYDYDYSYETLTTDSSYASGGIPAIVWVIYIAVIVVMIVAMWKVFTKAGKPGWASLIPLYNTYVMLQVVGRPWWWLLLMFIPFVNIVIAIIVTNDLAKSFGKGVGWTVGLLLLPFIFMPMLAFGNAKYGGPSVRPS
jgi:hypothetical protein